MKVVNLDTWKKSHRVQLTKAVPIWAIPNRATASDRKGVVLSRSLDELTTRLAELQWASISLLHLSYLAAWSSLAEAQPGSGRRTDATSLPTQTTSGRSPSESTAA